MTIELEARPDANGTTSIIWQVSGSNRITPHNGRLTGHRAAITRWVNGTPVTQFVSNPGPHGRFFPTWQDAYDYAEYALHAEHTKALDAVNRTGDALKRIHRTVEPKVKIIEPFVRTGPIEV